MQGGIVDLDQDRVHVQQRRIQIVPHRYAPRLELGLAQVQTGGVLKRGDEAHAAHHPRSRHVQVGRTVGRLQAARKLDRVGGVQPHHGETQLSVHPVTLRGHAASAANSALR
jgi:hypothetical protein